MNMDSKPPATKPLQHIMDLLWDMVKYLDIQSGSSILEKYDYFTSNSDHGRNCSFSRKCQSLFTSNNYGTIKEIVKKIVEQIREIEGPNWPR